MKTILLTCIFLLPGLLVAQTQKAKDFSISTSIPYESVNAIDKHYFSINSTTSISIKTEVSRSEESTVTIQRFDASGMREISRKEYTDFPINTTTEKIIRIGDRMFYFYSFKLLKTKTVALHVREINTKDGTLMASRLLFETQGYLLPVASTRIEIYPIPTPYPIYFDVFESADHSKILFQYRRTHQSARNSSNYDLIGLYTFNTNLEKLSGTEVKMPYTENALNYISYTAGNDGTAYMLILNSVTFQYELLTISSNGVLKSYPANITKGYFHELNIKETADGEFQCVSYYVESNFYKTFRPFLNPTPLAVDFSGVIRFTMTHTGVVTDQQIYEFPKAMMQRYEAAFKTKDSLFVTQQFLRIIQRTDNADGSTVLVGEQIHYAPSSINFDNIVVTKFDKAGRLVWMIKLPKRQGGSYYRKSLGLKYIHKGDYHYLLYMADKENEPIQEGEPPMYSNELARGFLTAFKIEDATGTFSKQTIFNIEDINGMKCSGLSTLNILNLSEDTFLLELNTKGKQDVTIKMMVK